MSEFLKNIKKRLGTLILKREQKYLKTNEDKLIYHAKSILEIIKGDCEEVEHISIRDFDNHSGLEWCVENSYKKINLKTDNKEEK